MEHGYTFRSPFVDCEQWAYAIYAGKFINLSMLNLVAWRICDIFTCRKLWFLLEVDALAGEFDKFETRCKVLSLSYADID